MKGVFSGWIGGLALWSLSTLSTMAPVAEAQNIVEAAIAAGFDTLVVAVETAGLVDVLATSNDLTVFDRTAWLDNTGRTTFSNFFDVIFKREKSI